MTIKEKLISIFAVIFAAVGAFFSILFGIEKSKNKKLQEDKKIQEQIEIDKYAERKRNEIKEAMETGNANNDFNTSIDILHDLATKR